MEQTSPAASDLFTGDAETIEAWSVHLARHAPARTAALWAVSCFFGGWSAFVFAHPVAFIMTAGLLVASTSEFLFPVRYRLTADFAEARGPLFWRRIAWSEVKRVYVGKGEVKLSPLKHGGPREAFRGVVLRLDTDPKALLPTIKRLRESAPAKETDAAAGS